MLLDNPCTLALQKVVIIICQPEPCIPSDWCFVPKHQLIRLVTGSTMWHCIICKHTVMVDVVAS